jgi:sialidase-1
MAVEAFEAMPEGEVSSQASVYGKWSADPGHATVIGTRARTGKQSLHLTGGPNRIVTLELDAPSDGKRSLDLWAERWTVRGSCDFTIEAKTRGTWASLKRETGVKVGGFDTRIQAEVPAGVSALRLLCSSDGGVIIDDLALNRSGPMSVIGLSTMNPVIPVLRHKPVNPVLGFTITTEGNEEPCLLEAVEISLDGTTNPQDIDRIELVPGKSEPAGSFGDPIATAMRSSGTLVMTPGKRLVSGWNSYWVSVVLRKNADIDGRIAVSLKRVKAGGKVLTPEDAAPATPRRIGVGLRLQGDDKSHSYRIPGLVRTKSGMLVAVYDVRYKHCGDLPAKIDVGVSRSADGGQTWEDMRIAMHPGTMGDDYEADGVGDPAILVDEKTGRLWLAALWSHGNRAWVGSGPGMTPEETGQFLIAHSDNDGGSWSALRNITPMVKDPAWKLCFNGPGAGISMKDGTLVFPAQFRSAEGGETNGKPFSTIIWSKDRGETWAIGTGARIDTTEAQVVELDDGSLMLNCRDNRGGSRTVMVTKDLGKTWTPHATDRRALPEPVCMASLLRWDHPQHGKLFVFSNPAGTKGRNHMTLKFSKDNAVTWPEKWHALYDERSSSGYSCIAPAGNDHVGVLYEGPCELYFLRVPLDECLN